MVIGKSDTADRWQQIDRIFHAALEVEATQRAAYVARASDGDDAVRREVERLLRHHDLDDGFLDTAALNEPIQRWAHDHGALAGRRVGCFRLDRQIGEGGMATVWLAHREGSSFTQRVAVKVMRWGPVTSNWRQRFESERRALARLEHPYITRLIDGGTAANCGDAADGLPYLVMEYVEGVPASAYCDRHRLTIRERLGLFCKICEAVHYAHQNLIVHRDLKPSNILVTSDGNPKLLDFGIAKLLTNESGPADAATVTLMRALTPRYASPEQVRGETITTASDVYSLGVMLYELLSGRRSYPDAGSSRYERERLVCEFEPTAPSLVVQSEAVPAVRADLEAADTVPAQIAAARRESLHSLTRRLRGDLDNIVLKAIQKDAPRRYSSVQQFREDIDRYLSGLPVIARKDTPGYRIAKFVRRNRPAVLGVTAAALALAVGVFGVIIGERRARMEADVAHRVTMFMQDVLASANPYRGGRDANVIDLLAAASRRVKRELRDQPAVAASVRYAIAEVYGGLWRWEDAEPQVRMALQLQRELYGDHHESVADSLALLGRALTFRACHESVDIQREAHATRVRLFGEDSLPAARSKMALAFAYWAASDPPNWSAAEALYREAIASFRRHKATKDPAYARSLFSFAAMYLANDDADEETEALLAEALSVYRTFPRQEDRYMSECLRAFAELHRRHGRYDAEASALEESLANTPDLFLSDDRVRESAWRRVELAAADGQGTQLRKCLHRALRTECARRRTRNLVPESPWDELEVEVATVTTVRELLGALGKFIDRLPMQPCHWNLELTERLLDIAPKLAETVDADVSALLSRRCLDYQITRFPFHELKIAFARVRYGQCLLIQNKIEEAEEQLLSGYKQIHPQLRGSDRRHVAVVEAIVRLYELQGLEEKAARFRAKLPIGPLGVLDRAVTPRLNPDRPNTERPNTERRNTECQNSGSPVMGDPTLGGPHVSSS